MYFMAAGYPTSGLNTGSDVFESFFGASNFGTTGSDAILSNIVPVAFTLSNFQVYFLTPPGVGKSWTLTVQKNGSPTTLVATVADTNVQASDITHSVSFAAGDTIGIKVTPSGTPTSAGNNYGWSAIGNTGDNTAPIIGLSQGPSTTVTSYANIFGGLNGLTTTENSVQVIAPIAGTLSNLQLAGTTAPGSGNSWTFKVRINGADSSLSASMANTATTASDTTHSVAISPGDLITISSTPVGTPVSYSRLKHSLNFKPKNFGESFIGGVLTSEASNTATTFVVPLSTNAVGPNVGETSSDIPFGPCFIKNFYVSMGTAPGTGKSWDFTLRKNEADTSLAFSVANTATSANATKMVRYNSGDRLSLKQVPTSTPGVMSTIKYSMGIAFPSDGLMPFLVASV